MADSSTGFVRLAPIAVDGTTLLAADSFLEIDATVRDPGARSAFEFVVNAFCSSRPLIQPHPSGKLHQSAPPLFTLWNQTAQSVATQVAVPVNPLASAHDLRHTFFRRVEFDAPLISAWLVHQLQPSNYRQYIDGGNNLAQLAKMVEFVESDFNFHRYDPRTIEAWSRYGSFGTRIVDLQSDAGLGDFETLKVALAYTLQAAAKGVAYASHLYESHPDTLYRCHWLRESLLDSGAVTRRVNAASRAGSLFPWGTFSAAVIDAESQRLRREPGRIVDWLRQLRDFAHIHPPQSNFTDDEFENYALTAAKESGLQTMIGYSGIEDLVRASEAQSVPLSKDERNIVLRSASHLQGSYNKEQEHVWRFESAISEALSAYRRTCKMSTDPNDVPSEASPSVPLNSEYDAFIACNSVDLDIVRRYVEKFREYGILVFYYPDSMPIGLRWRSVIEVLMGQRPNIGHFRSRARCGVILYGPSGVGRVQDEEIDLAWEVERSGLFNIIPVVLSEVSPNWQPEGWMKIRTFCDLRNDEKHQQWDRLISTIKTATITAS